jgi:hypothetical protein
MTRSGIFANYLNQDAFIEVEARILQFLDVLFELEFSHQTFS